MHTDTVLFAAVSYFKFNCLDQSVYFLLEYLNILVHIVAHTQEHTHTQKHALKCSHTHFFFHLLTIENLIED